MAPRRISGRDPANGAQTTVTIEHGRIASIDSAKSLEQAWLSPGLVDLQVNGFGGHDVNVPDLTADAIAALARAVAARGATTFLPTIVTTSPERIDRALVTIAEARREDALSRRAIPCVHVEGPSISPEDGPRGAHPREWTRPPDLSEFHAWQSASGDLVGLVTLSPHWPGAPDYIRALVARGVRVAIGHTHADAEQIAAAADAGATLSTHLGNGAHAMLPRHPNYLWAQLANERFAASFIATNPDYEGNDLQVSYSQDNGKTWARPFVPHHDGTEQQHAFATFFELPGNALGVSWLDGRDTQPSDANPNGGPMTLRYAAYDAQWKRTAEGVIDQQACECCSTMAAMTSEGVLIAFRDRSDKEIRDIAV